MFRGGTAAILHRYFYPNDVEGTIPYAERHSLGLQDVRTPHFLAHVDDARAAGALRALLEGRAGSPDQRMLAASGIEGPSVESRREGRL